MEKIEIGLSVAIGIYELLSRIIPTTKTWSIVGNLLKVAKRVSDGLDWIKKK